MSMESAEDDEVEQHVINCWFEDDDDDFIAVYMPARRRNRKVKMKSIVNTLLAGSASEAALCVQFN